VYALTPPGKLSPQPFVHVVLYVLFCEHESMHRRS
jgi:hypothetical protein